ncbi:phytanoyl-CoA dioxygenase family protein [Candidatus Poribacteria bacterium]|nr:phytanoyl-CoA dioxygenase family protein [Candidatus Poribacteria bacterium]
MDREVMSNEENYCFDVAGYLIVRGVLTKEEVGACNRDLDTEGTGSRAESLAKLRDHPQLVWYLNQICGEEFRLDQEPCLIGDAEEDVGAPLIGGNEPRDWARAYNHQNDVRFCQGVLAIWALADVEEGDGGFVLIPASHKNYVETPKDVLTGADDMGLTVQPPLKAGDLLLCAETTLHGVSPWQGNGPQRLFACGYIGKNAPPSISPDVTRDEEPPPEWLAELTPVQRAVIQGQESDDASFPAVVRSDGETSWIDESSEIFHPSIYIRDPDSLIDEKEFYFWDLCGHLVLRNVMDAAWLEAANEAIDKFADRIVVGAAPDKGSKTLAGTGRPDLGGLFELPKPYCDPFREMIAHPAVIHRVNWMVGSGFRCGNATAICSVKGTAGHALHSGSEPARPGNGYFLQNGRTYCDSVNVGWQLRDVTEADGGFVCVPGTHKARYPMPPGVQSCDEPMGLVQHVSMKAGDVLIFLAGAQTHGAYPWQSDIQRRTVLMNYRSKDILL